MQINSTAERYRLVADPRNVLYRLRTRYFGIDDTRVISHLKPIDIPVTASHEVCLIAECLLAHIEYAVSIGAAGSAEASVLLAERSVIPLPRTTVHGADSASGNQQVERVESAVSDVNKLDDHLFAAERSLEIKLEAVAALGSAVIESRPAIGYLAADFYRSVGHALKGGPSIATAFGVHVADDIAANVAHLHIRPPPARRFAAIPVSRGFRAFPIYNGRE